MRSSPSSSLTKLCTVTFLSCAGLLWSAGDQSLSSKREEEWRKQITATLFVPDPLPPLAAETHGRFEPAPGVVAERVTYGTQFGMRIPAILYLPKSQTGKVPGLIIVNGHGGDKYSWYSFYSGILYARAGAAVLTYDPAGEGERNIDRRSGTRAHDKVEPPPELARRLAGLMMTDVMQGVSYLTERAEVDSRRIAALGYSMGSFVLSLTCAVERRLHACVLVGGGNLDGPGGYWDNSKPMCQGIPYQSLKFLGDRAAVIYALHAARGRTLVYNGLADVTVAIPRHGEALFTDLQRRVAELRGSSHGIFETGFEAGVAHRPFFVTKPVALWLEKHLNFPNWTEGSIDALQETHISEWARGHGVEMDPLYASEEREGGTPALGAEVPALSRTDLSVFSPQDWERQKSRMIHETWLKEAKSRVTKDTASQTNGKYAYVDTREFPGDRKETSMFSGLYAASDGILYVTLCTHAGSSQIYKYDPRADRVVHIADVAEFLGQTGRGIRTAGKIHTRPVEDREGRIYFATMCEDSGPPNIDPYSWEGPHWLRYDPKADKLENLGRINRLWGIYGLAIDKTRNRLFGTAWDGHLYRLDIDTGETHDLGRVDNWDDLRHIAADSEGNVYGCYPKTRIWKYDVWTERVYDLSVQIPYDPLVYPRRLSNPMLDRKAIWRVVEWDPEDKVIYGIDGSSSILFKYDPKDGAEGKVTQLERLCADAFYYSSRKDIPYSTLAFTIGKDRKIYYAPAGVDFDYSAKLEAAQLAHDRGGIKTSPHSELITYDLKKHKRENLGILKTKDGRHVFGCGAAACGRDGAIYLCAATGVKDGGRASGRVGDEDPYTLQLLIYRPE